MRFLADVAKALYKNARIEAADVCEAQSMLLRAELDAATTELDRIAIYRKWWAHCRNSSSGLRGEQNARGTDLPVLKIKAQGLEVEIRLEQAKARAAHGAK